MPRSAYIGLWGAIAALVSSCVHPPSLEPPDGADGDAGGPAFADTLMAITVGGVAMSCLGQLSDCSVSIDTGACPSNAALGPKDGRTYPLGPGEKIEVAFRCGVIHEHGSDTANPTIDFRIWSTVPEGGQATLEVSFDGLRYQSLGFLTLSDQAFDIGVVEADLVRFVRLTNSGAMALAIDAVEAL